MNKNLLMSLKKNEIGIYLMIIASILVAVGQLFWKLSDGSKINYIIMGFSLYALGSLSMLVAFKHGSLSVLHPILCLSYIVSIICGIIRKKFLKIKTG